MLLISQLFFVTYTVWVAARFGIQESISASWYKLNSSTWPLFTLFTWGTALPIIMMDLGPLYLLGGVCLTFVGVAGAFRDARFIKIIHNFSTYLAIFFLCLALALEGIWWVPVFTAVFFTISKAIKLKNLIWWNEYIVYLLIILGIASI